MPTVVPSNVIALIDQTFPNARTSPAFPVYSGHAATLSAIVSLSEEIPNELLTISGEDYTDLIHGLEALAHSVTHWNQRGGDEPPKMIKGKSAVAVVREMLSKCPDQYPSSATAGFTFIADTELRDSIRLDLSTATSAFHNSEWKAATVLAGAVMEALLLWVILRDPTLLSGIPGVPKKPPKNWTFSELLDVAFKARLIEPSTATQVSLAKNFRNLIHPGRARRTQEICDRGTALSARHAQLAVNLAGTMATFLVETWNERQV